MQDIYNTVKLEQLFLNASKQTDKKIMIYL